MVSRVALPVSLFHQKDHTPEYKKNQLITTQFMSRFPELLEDLATRYQKLVLLGDINLPFVSTMTPT